VCVYLCPLTFIYLQEHSGPNSIQLQLSNPNTGLGLRKPTATELEVLLNCRAKVVQSFCCCTKCRGSLEKNSRTCRPKPVSVNVGNGNNFGNKLKSNVAFHPRIQLKFYEIMLTLREYLHREVIQKFFE